MKLTRILMISCLASITFLACESEVETIAPPAIVSDIVAVTEYDHFFTIDENPVDGTSLGSPIHRPLLDLKRPLLDLEPGIDTPSSGIIDYSWEDESAPGALNMNPLTGELTIANGSLIDFESASTVTATLVSTKKGVQTRDNITINLNNLVLTEEEGLMAYYTFDDEDIAGTTATNTINTDHHGVAHNLQLVGDRWVTYGRTSKAYQFGHNGRITIPSFGTDLTSFTITAWIRYNGNNANKRKTIVSKAGDNTEYAFNIKGQSCNCLESHINTETMSIDAGTAIPTNFWRHVAMVYDNGTMRIYENGENVASHSDMPEVDWSDNDINIGSMTTSGSDHFFGEIDDIGFFNRAITEEEINILRLDIGA